MSTTGEAKARLAEQRQNAGTQVAKRDQPTGITSLIEQMRPQIERALPRTMNADRFARIVLTTLRQNPRLMQCEPQSLLAACMLTAQLGLEPGPLGHAYFVPFGKNITYIVGYRGLLELARRSGEIKSIEAREVREHDLFEYEYGLDPKLKHRPATGDRGELTHVYGVAKFVNGGHYFDVMDRDEVEAIRKRSRASSDGPWVTDFAAMARKSVIRRMAPYLPMSAEMARAVESDEGVVANLSDLASEDGEVRAAQGDVIDVDAEPDDTDDAEVVDAEENPDTLTKAQLAKRLRDAEIPFEANAKKDVLRGLWKSHLYGDAADDDDAEVEDAEVVEPDSPPAGDGEAPAGGGSPAWREYAEAMGVAPSRLLLKVRREWQGEGKPNDLNDLDKAVSGDEKVAAKVRATIDEMAG